MTETTTKKLPLHHRLTELGARFVPFAGYDMPVRFGSILEEHKAVRTNAGVFDVSHMGEIEFFGPRAGEVVNELITNDISGLVDGQAVYTAMCNPHGGIVDDLIVYRLTSDHYLACVNAGNRKKDADHIDEVTAGRCRVEDRSDEYVQLAVQGPNAASLVARLADIEVDRIPYYHGAFGHVAGVHVLLSRTGYTGEDGFELYYPSRQATMVFDALWDAGKSIGLRMCGLGARDVLRLEARMLLYGNDMNDETTPLEAGLNWVVKFNKGEFVGRQALLAQKEAGSARRLRGFILEGAGVLRPHYPIFLGDQPIGETTSGGPSPTLDRSIALGYVKSAHADEPMVDIQIRGLRHPCSMTKKPFYKRPGGVS